MQVASRHMQCYFDITYDGYCTNGKLSCMLDRIVVKHAADGEVDRMLPKPASRYAACVKPDCPPAPNAIKHATDGKLNMLQMVVKTARCARMMSSLL